jgi:hypothetical protein
MSLDLLKNALFQAVTASIPGLKMYPEHVDTAHETFPNLSFIEVTTQNLGARPYQEAFLVPNPDPSGAPYLLIPVIARKRSVLRMQLRDSLGSGKKDAKDYQRIREQHNAIDRFLTKVQVIKLGPSGSQTLAELEYANDREDYDRESGIFLHEYELRVDPWRLLDAGPGIPTYRADEITLEVKRERDSALLITRLYPRS